MQGFVALMPFGSGHTHSIVWALDYACSSRFEQLLRVAAMNQSNSIDRNVDVAADDEPASKALTGANIYHWLI